MTPDTEAELNLVVATRRDAADDVVVLELRNPDGSDLPPWTPGAHIDAVLTDDLTRQYSLCGDPADRTTWRIGVLREPEGRGGSQFVHDKVSVGDTVRVRGPRNQFELETAPAYLFIAGGIGITPIMAMVTAAEESGATWKLVYGGRSRGSMAFADELLDAHPESVTLVPEDECGRLDLVGLLGEPKTDTAVYACGPGGLLDAVTERCAAWPEDTLHVERFTPKDVGAPVRSGSFEVELAVTGQTITVSPDESVLEAIEATGIGILSSCREGTCGTCETPVLEGTVDHRDSLLTVEEQNANDTMMVCVSRSRCPRLVLEL